jgi:xanthine dehydrogenase accessory factor
MGESTDSHLLRTIEDACRAGAPFALVTTMAHGRTSGRFIFLENGECRYSSIGRAPREVVTFAVGLFNSGRRTALSEIIDSEGAEIVVACEIVRPKPSLIIFGAGHVGQALALMAIPLGYQITVVDDRAGFISRERFPDRSISLVAEGFETASRSVTITSSTAVVIVTRGHQYDELCLRETVGSSARYIGMIGSQRRVRAVYERLGAAGVPRDLLEKVHAPIGLKIGATTPQEIAVAILGEIIETFNRPASRS